MANPSTTNPAPLRLVLLITFLGSMGTAVITNGLSFIADQGLGYSGTQNLLLALALGAVYIPAALLSAPIQRRLITTTPLTTRRILLLMMILLTIIAQVPMIAQSINPAWTEAALWILGIGYMILVGMLWPIVEGYLSGGRSGKPLRNAIGKFNIVWSTSMVLAYWLMAPLIESSPFLIIALLGGVHILIAAFIWKLPDEPPKAKPPQSKTTQTTDHPTPPVYRPLLSVFRVMLICSYIILSAIIPLMPSTQARLGLDELWWTPIASTWLIVRVFVFILFERWHGWHGRWWTPWFGMSTMLIGFALSMGSPMLGDSAIQTVNVLGVLALIGGLSLMGVGIAATYYGALYYAMAVGGSDIDSGGKHEALIGVGYTAGPLCGLIGGAIYTGGLGVIAVTTLVVLTMIGVALFKATKR